MNLWSSNLLLAHCFIATFLNNFVKSTDVSQDSKVVTPSTTSQSQDAKDNIDLSKLTVLTLDSKSDSKTPDPKENNTNHYELKEVSKDTVHSYVFKDGVKCIEVKYDKHSLWTYDKTKTNEPYPKSVLLFLKTKTVMVTFKDDDILYVYNFVDTEWKTLVKGKVTLGLLDVAKKESSSESDYSKDGDNGIFVAKDGNLFKEVIKTKSGSSCGSDYTFLEAKEHSQYCYKVIRDGIGSFTCMKNVTLYLVNGDITKYTSSGSFSKTWTKDGQVITQKQTRTVVAELEEQKLKEIDKSEYPQEIKLISKDQQSSDETNKSGTEGTQAESGSTKYVVKKGLDGIFHYEFDNFECTEVKYNDETVWTSGQLSKEKLKLIHYICVPKVLIFDFTQDVYYLYFRSKSDNKYEWECFSLEKMNEDLKSKVVIVQEDRTKAKSNYGIKYYGFGLEVKFGDGLKPLNISYDYHGNGNHVVPFWNYNQDKYKGVYPVAAYFFKNERYLFLFKKAFVLDIDENKKVDPKSSPSGGTTT